MSVVATTGHWFTLRLNWRCSEFACGCGQEFENARDLVHHVQLARGASCWCCAVWGLVTPAEVPDQGGGYVCSRCQGSSTSACKQRHVSEALKAAKQPAQAIKGDS